MNNLLFFFILGVGWKVGKAEISLREPTKGFWDNDQDKTTLEKVKIIGHPSSGRCLILENPKRQGETRETQFILRDCHHKGIKGLEQEMYMLVKSNGGGYLIMGKAGSVDHCVSAGSKYYDLVVSRRCDPFDENQSWTILLAPGKSDEFQLVHKATGRCIRAPGVQDGAWVRVGDCELGDSHQLWHICGLNGLCDF